MIRTRWFFGQGIFLLLLSLLLTTAATAQTDGTLNVKAREPELLFGESIRFDLTASSMADITSAVLTYRTLNNQAMIVQNLDFAPNDQIELHHTVDLVSNPLKPFVQIEYWWMVSDASGHKVTTASKVFTYKDNRFETWQSLAGQRVTVHWYSGGDEFGIRALGIAEQAVDEIRVMISLSSDISEPFHLYLYASENDLLPALPD